MLNEKGAICATTEITAEAQKEILHGQTAGFIALFVVSVLFSALYIVLLVILKPFPYYLHMLALFIFFIILCPIYFFGTAAGLKKAKAEKKVMYCEFYLECLVDRLYLNGEEIAGDKTYYGELLKRRETKNYIVLYKTANSVYVVEKSQLPPEELETLRNILGLGGNGFVK